MNISERVIFSHISQNDLNRFIKDYKNINDKYNLRNNEGSTLLLYCCKCNRLNIMNYIFEMDINNEIDINMKISSSQTTLLLEAFENEHMEIVSYLLTKKEIIIDVCNRENNNVFHILCIKSNFKLFYSYFIYFTKNEFVQTLKNLLIKKNNNNETCLTIIYSKENVKNRSLLFLFKVLLKYIEIEKDLSIDYSNELFIFLDIAMNQIDTFHMGEIPGRFGGMTRRNISNEESKIALYYFKKILKKIDVNIVDDENKGLIYYTLKKNNFKFSKLLLLGYNPKKFKYYYLINECEKNIKDYPKDVNINVFEFVSF
jgi:hypothetical protein